MQCLSGKRTTCPVTPRPRTAGQVMLLSAGNIALMLSPWQRLLSVEPSTATLKATLIAWRDLARSLHSAARERSCDRPVRRRPLARHRLRYGARNAYHSDETLLCLSAACRADLVPSGRVSQIDFSWPFQDPLQSPGQIVESQRTALWKLP